MGYLKEERYIECLLNVRNFQIVAQVQRNRNTLINLGDDLQFLRKFPSTLTVNMNIF